MATNANKSTLETQLSELLKRVEWLDEQNRKTGRKMAELEQKNELQGRKIAEREQRIQELERQLAKTNAQLNRIPQVDVQLSQFQDDIVAMLEQYDKRHENNEREIDRLRRIEHESITREIADIRKELPAIPRLGRDLELRQAEESRLSNLLAIQQGDIAALRNTIEEYDRNSTYLDEKEKQNSRTIAEIQTQILEINKRWDPINSRIEIIANTLAKAENTRQDLVNAQIEQREVIKRWAEQIQLGEHERNKQIENWRYVLDEHNDAMSRYSREWVKFSDQYHEAKMALQTFTEWQKQMEQRTQEANELIRVETHRMQDRWAAFTKEDTQKWKTFQIEAEQRWQNMSRVEKQLREQIMELENMLIEVEKEKDLLWRIQNAQADAIKKFPRVWLEEMERARAQDPNRRRQPTLVPVREE